MAPWTSSVLDSGEARICSRGGRTSTEVVDVRSATESEWADWDRSLDDESESAWKSS